MNIPNISERLVQAMEKTHQLSEAQRRTGGPAGVSPQGITIALSREAGACGAEVAHAVGERLGWPVYDRELLQKVAEEWGLRTNLLEGVDEKQKGWFAEAMEALTTGRMISDVAFVKHLLETLLSLAANGQCVVVGRGAAQVLPLTTTLRVRLIRPMADRVAHIQHKMGFTKEEAARWVAKTDRDRAAFVREHFQKNPDDPLAYDLIINSSRFTIAECTDLILDALKRWQARAHYPAATK
jgi:cytidylate kinase